MATSFEAFKGRDIRPSYYRQLVIVNSARQDGCQVQRLPGLPNKRLKDAAQLNPINAKQAAPPAHKNPIGMARR